MAASTAVKLNIENKPEDLNPRQIRANGNVPITLYGKGVESKSFQINAHAFKMAYKNNSDSVYELSFGKEKFSVKIKDVQLNYSTNDVLNVEFQLV